jgi:hypothetical protein
MSVSIYFLIASSVKLPLLQQKYSLAHISFSQDYFCNISFRCAICGKILLNKLRYVNLIFWREGNLISLNERLFSLAYM